MSCERLGVYAAVVVPELRGKLDGPRPLSAEDPDISHIQLSQLSEWTNSVLLAVKRGELRLAVDVAGNVVVAPPHESTAFG